MKEYIPYEKFSKNTPHTVTINNTPANEVSSRAIQAYIAGKSVRLGRHKAPVFVFINEKNVFSNIIHIMIQNPHHNPSVRLEFGDRTDIDLLSDIFSSHEDLFQYIGNSLIIDSTDSWGRKVHISISSQSIL